MPSGYTDKIKDGISFQEFALRCARNFGGLIHMRDEEFDSKITLPSESGFDSNYHKGQLDEANKRLKELQTIDMNAYKAEAIKGRKEEIARIENAIKEKNELRGKYMEMLMEVKAWRPPTEHHTGLKTFMTQQITDSISFDCDTTYYEEELVKLNEPVKVEDVLNKELEMLNNNIKYHTEKLEETEGRNDDRGAWLIDLVKSLRMTPEQKEELLDFDV
jgi:hypothetical protein